LSGGISRGKGDLAEGMMEAWVYLDGQIIPAAEAKISALDLSIQRGYGVMDYLRTYEGRPFRLRDHLYRFQNSAREVGIELLKSIEEMTAIVEEMIEKVEFPEVSLKLILTGGVSPDHYLPIDNPTFFVIAYPLSPFPEAYFREGIHLMTMCYSRPFPSAKSTLYLPAIVAMRRAKKMGAADVLFYSEEGHILETGTSNFFAVKGGTIITPASSILKGVTRQVVLELAEEKFSIEERVIQFSEISTFDGAFLTSSNKEVMPVTRIDEHQLAIPDEVRTLMEDFSNFVHDLVFKPGL